MYRRLLLGALGWLLIVGCIAGCIAGCRAPNPARDAALRDAELARKRGDTVAAAFAYTRACQADPQNTDNCNAARIWSRDAANQLAARGHRICDVAPEKLDVLACLHTVAPGRQLVPQHRELLRMAEAAGRVHAARCQSAPAQDPASAIQLMRCMAQVRALVKTRSYEGKVIAAGQQAAATFTDLAMQASTRPPGAQAALWSAAACYDRSADTRRREAASRAEFLSAARQPLTMRVHGGGASDPARSPTMQTICARTASALGDRVKCQPASAIPGVIPAIPVDVQITLGMPQHAVDQETRSKRYQSGVNRYPNPEYRTAERRERDTREDWREAERSVRQQESECQRARTQAAGDLDMERAVRDACDSYTSPLETAKRAARDRKDDHERAERELRQTPSIIEEPVYRDHVYIVRLHRFSVSWVARIVLSDGNGTEASGKVTYEDEEADGFGPAGLPDDPLAPPATGWYETPVASKVSEHAVRVVEGELGRRVTARRAECSGDQPVWNGTWLECWAEISLWAGQAPQGIALIRASAQAADRLVGGTGLPMPECL